jgi:peptidoglycan/LPS O-acetylase OafA/YrhL
VFACLATATVSYYCIEKPLIRLGRRVAERLSQPAAHRSHGRVPLAVETVAE